MTSIELLAPAKVNLFLKVLNRRRDSYHNILTLFERISLADKIKIMKQPKGISVRADRFITHNPRENLAYRAARLILKKRNVKGGVRIEIEKTIPIASGLGGGSSDAAAVLIGINKLFGLKLKRLELLRLARQLGADVSFFILERPFAVGRSRGDRLEPLRSKAVLWHLLIYPGFGISTKEVYRGFDAQHLSNPSAGSGFDPEFIEGSTRLTRKFDDVKINRFLRNPLDASTPLGIHPEHCRGMDFDTAERMLHNDLEDIVRFKNGIIGKIEERLARILGRRPIVSGSGPSLFCLYPTRKEAKGARKKFLESVPARERKGWQVFVVRTC